MEKPITKEHKLENGLKIVVREDHRAPVAVAQIWYKVGSADEPRGVTGISHALEHMMFQGTSAVPGDGFSARISKLGGRDNAFTGEDYTAYYEELDAAHLAVSFELEADRMTHLTLSKEAFDKEIQVVIEERRLRTDDNPQGVTWERFEAVAHLTGPYHHPVVGWRSDLDHMTIEDVRRWYGQWYAPNNATIVVVGDVQADHVFALAQQYFGALPARALPVEKPTQELASLGEKRIKVEVPAKLPYVIWGFDVPSLKTTSDEAECYALLVAAAVLDGGESARFARESIRGTQIATSLHASYQAAKRYATQFVVAGTPSHGHTVTELEQHVMAQLDRLRKEPISVAELQRVKTQLSAQEVFDKDSMSEQASTLGLFETVGLSWTLADEFLQKVSAVTPEQVQQAAQKYFHPKRLTVAELVPQAIHS